MTVSTSAATTQLTPSTKDRRANFSPTRATEGLTSIQKAEAIGAKCRVTVPVIVLTRAPRVAPGQYSRGPIGSR
jgi:hypothetical protein